ncbi:hypothetical protein Goari_000010 [Gossypium aridum]|uniref:Transposase MuDR plant domain-containing protein n=1 Tax=Gossypium aridum TaxID=34290 RepID=A0A7J8YRT2_GOSAI|nr:hypothetical protein [Gossypium aridum]
MFLLTVGEGDVKRVEIDGESDDKWVEFDGEGDLERVESVGEDDVRGVQVDGEGVSATGIEVDEYGGVKSGGQISLGSTVKEDNDSEVAVDEYAGDFATSNGVDNIADGYAGDFATSDGVHNVTVASSGEEEDGNETKDEHHCSVSFKDKMMTAAMIAQHFEVTIKDHPKMKLREIQKRCASEMHVNVTINCCYRSKKIVKEKMIRNHKEEPLIGLDGCFLKGPFKNEFLTAIGRDANNQMFPIAWAVVEMECTDS